ITSALDASMPPLAVPPSSHAVMVTVTGVPAPTTAASQVSIPVSLTAGRVAKAASLSVATSNATACPVSLAGPGEIPLIQLATTCGPSALEAEGPAPGVNEGASFTAAIVSDTVASDDWAPSSSATRYVNWSAPLKSALGL